MRIRFVSPPVSKQLGGVEHAVEGLRESLLRQGVEVLDGGDPDDTDALHHFHGLWNFSHSRLAAKLHGLGRPYVVSPHGMLEPWALRHRRWKKWPYFRLVEREYLARAQSIFVTGAMEEKNLARVIRHSCVVVIPLGCRDRRQPDHAAARLDLNWPADEHVILYLSRIDVKKGLDMLLQAMDSDDYDWHGWRLVIVGDGDVNYVSSLEAIIAAAGERLPEIEWVGPIWGAARWPYLQAADLFCLPTHSENFGLAVLEALHVGTPVLTTDQTPWVEFGDRAGIFIGKPEVASLQTSLSKARENVGPRWSPDDRRNLAAWADELFAWDKLAPLYVEAYQRSVDAYKEAEQIL